MSQRLSGASRFADRGGISRLVGLATDLRHAETDLSRPWPSERVGQCRVRSLPDGDEQFELRQVEAADCSHQRQTRLAQQIDAVDGFNRKSLAAPRPLNLFSGAGDRRL